MTDGVLSTPGSRLVRRRSEIPLAERQVHALERLASAEEERNRRPAPMTGERVVIEGAPQPGLLPVRVVVAPDGAPVLVWLHGVPRRDDFVNVPDDGHYGPVYRVDWGSDGIPTIFLR